jgi:hypothetical protein
VNFLTSSSPALMPLTDTNILPVWIGSHVGPQMIDLDGE